MQLDYITLGITISVVGFVSAIVMTVLWRINPSERGPGLWAIAAIIGATGFLFVGLTPILGGTAIFINNVSTLSVQLIILEGILRFRNFGNRSSRRVYILLLLIFFVFLSYFNQNDATVRYLFHDAIVSVLLILSAFFLVYRTYGMERIVHSIASSAFLVLTSGLIYRWYLAYSGEISPDFPNHPFMGTLFLLIIFWTLGWTFGLIMAINFKAQKSIMKMATEDNLTGIANRRGFNDLMENIINESKVENQKFIIFMIDLNGFKKFNDTYGHAFGDEVLIFLADAIKEYRGSDISARLGGDEFIIVTKSMATDENINILKEGLRESVEREKLIMERKVILRISIGVSVFPDDGQTSDELLLVADHRMYEDKKVKELLSEVIC